MNKCTELQFITQQSVKNEVECLMSHTDIDWDRIISRIEHLKKVKEWLPDVGSEVKVVSEWHDPSKYREGFTIEEYAEWLKIKAMESMENTLKENT